MSNAFSLSGQITIDSRRATQELREFQRELEGATAHLKGLLNGKKSVTLKVNAKDASSALQQVAKDAQRTAKKSADVMAREAERGLKAQTKAVQQMAREQEKLARDAERQVRQSARAQAREQDKSQREALRKQKEFGAAWGREIDATFRREGETLNRWGERVRTVTGLLKDIERGVKDIKVGFKVDPRGDLKMLKRQIQEAQKAAGATKVELKSDEAKAHLAGLMAQLKGIAGAAKVSVEINQKGELKGAEAGGDAGGAAEALKKQLESASEARAALLEKVSQVATVSGASIMGGLGLATNNALKFDAALRNVNTVAQMTEPNLQSLARTLIQVSGDKSVKQDAQNLVEAMNGIYSAGFKGAKALDILRQSARGATAGQTETAVASEVLMSTLSSGVPGVNNAKQAMDALFQIVNLAKFQFPELASSIGQVLPTAAAAKIPIQHLGAAIATLNGNGQSCSEATNDLLNLISKIASPSKGAEKAFKSLGIAYGFTGLQAKGLPAIIEQIKQKTHGHADEIKKLLPDMQAQRAVLSLLSKDGAKWKENLAGMQDAYKGAGAASKALAKANEGEAAAADRAQKDFNNLSLTMGRVMLPALNEVLKVGNQLFGWFNKLSPATQENTVKNVALAGGLLLLVGRLKSLIDTIALVKMAFAGKTLATAAATVATTINTAATATNAGMQGRLGLSLNMVRARLIATSATSVTASGRMMMAFKSIGVPLLAITAIIWGVRTAIIGTRDAGVMSADKLIEKWGALGQVWVAGGDALGGLISKLNGTAAASANADSRLAALNRTRADARAGGYNVPKSDVWRTAHGLAPIDGSHADGLVRVPKDGYVAELHKNEAVLTAVQAKAWRAQQARSIPGAPPIDFPSPNLTAQAATSTSQPAPAPRPAASAPRITQAILASVTTQAGISNCANVAGQILRKMGIPIKPNNYAQTLAQNAAKIARRIPVDQAGPGDLIVWHDPKKYGARQKHLGGRRSGYHVAAAAGNGRWVGNRGGKDRSISSGEIYDRAHAYAYDTSVLARRAASGGIGADGLAVSVAQLRAAQARAEKAVARNNQGFNDDLGRLNLEKQLADLERKLKIEKKTEDVISRRVELERYEQDLHERQSKGEISGQQAKALTDAFKSRQAAQAALEATSKSIEKSAAASSAQKSVRDERDKMSFDKHLADLERKLKIEKTTEDVISRRLDLERYEHELSERKQNKEITAPQASALSSAFKSRQDAQVALEATNKSIEKATQAAEKMQEQWAQAGKGLGEDLLSSFSSMPSLSDIMGAKLGAFNAVLGGDGSSGPALSEAVGQGLGAWGEGMHDTLEKRDEAARDRADRMKSFLDDMQNRAGQAFERDPIAREMLNIKTQLTRDGWSPEDIQKVLPTARWSMDVEQLQSNIDGVMNDVSGTFSNAFGALYDKGPKGFFDELENGLKSTLKNMATQILSSAATQWMSKLLGGVLGSAFGGASNLPPGASPGWHAPMALPGHAAGLDRVPRDNYVARLHRDEMVLNAHEAQRYRAQDRSMAVAGAGAGGRSAAGGSSTSSTMIINNSYSIGTVKSDNPQEFVKQLPGRQMPAGAQRAGLRRALGPA